MTERNSFWATVRLAVLSLISCLVLLHVTTSLVSSVNEPQATSRLQLYQTDLLLEAAQWEGGEILTPDELNDLRGSFLGNSPLETATEQYQTVRDQAQAILTRSPSPDPTTALEATPVEPALMTPNPQLERVRTRSQLLLDQLDLRLGLLQVQQEQVVAARQSWAGVTMTGLPMAVGAEGTTAQILQDLWSEPPLIDPDAQLVLQSGLDGWFRFRGLERLYTLQQRPEALTELREQEQAIAEQAFIKLALVGVVPIFGCIFGVIILIFLGSRWLVKGDRAWLGQGATQRWTTPWDWDTIIQVMMVGFFFMGQIVIPLTLQVIGLRSAGLSGREGALQSLTFYLLMSASGLFILYLSIRAFLPLPKQEWFQFKWQQPSWIAWGTGGYLVALPLMLGISLLNQQIWQGQGGSNPLLETVLQEGDLTALGIFLGTAAIAAPLFEETLFRGFLLPSLTRYVPVWGAIVLSSLVFAIAHLSISEVLPLTVLGCVLGIVYTRSRNLLAPMLLHGLWNGATMASLFILGGNS